MTHDDQERTPPHFFSNVAASSSPHSTDSINLFTLFKYLPKVIIVQPLVIPKTIITWHYHQFKNLYFFVFFEH